MPARTDSFDLGRLRMTSGEGRTLGPGGAPGSAAAFGGETYRSSPPAVPVVLDISRMTGGGYALRLRFSAALSGPCMRCLEPAAPAFAVDAREVDQPGGGEELTSPYVDGRGARPARLGPRRAHARAARRRSCAARTAPACARSAATNLNDAPDHAHERRARPALGEAARAEARPVAVRPSVAISRTRRPRIGRSSCRSAASGAAPLSPMARPGRGELPHRRGRLLVGHGDRRVDAVAQRGPRRGRDLGAVEAGHGRPGRVDHRRGARCQ